jgi:hypothetical protein
MKIFMYGRLPPALFAVMILAPCGCSEEEGGNTARLIVGSETEPPYPFDEIQIGVTASRTQEGNLCEPASRQFAVGEGDLPLIVDYVFGPDYRAWAAFSVVWMMGGAPVGRRDVIAPFFEGERNEVTILFQAACAELSCGDSLQCVDGACTDLPDPGPFTTPDLVDNGTSCSAGP